MQSCIIQEYHLDLFLLAGPMSPLDSIDPLDGRRRKHRNLLNFVPKVFLLVCFINVSAHFHFSCLILYLLSIYTLKMNCQDGSNGFHHWPTNGQVQVDDELDCINDCIKELSTTNPMNLPSPLKNKLINEFVENKIQRQATASIFHGNSHDSHSLRKLHSQIVSAGKAKLASFMVQKKLAQSSLAREIALCNHQWHHAHPMMDKPNPSLPNNFKWERPFPVDHSITNLGGMMSHIPCKNLGLSGSHSASCKRIRLQRHMITWVHL
jgi:hypothetical protein